MSGVIDDTGQQWEHCNACNAWVQLEELYWQRCGKGHPLWFLAPHGRDLCIICAHALWERGEEIHLPNGKARA
jgi:hypothetical protein